VAELRLELKYGPNGERVIRHIKRVSKPGRRVYCRATGLRPVLNGLGISIISTSRGVISDREARQRNLGGEVLCEVW
jgi:small subunit ribosomal protein S8